MHLSTPVKKLFFILQLDMEVEMERLRIDAREQLEEERERFRQRYITKWIVSNWLHFVENVYVLLKS